MVWVLIALGVGIVGGFITPAPDRHLFFRSVALVVAGPAIAIGWGLAGGGFGPYWGALVSVAGMGGALAFAIAAVRHRTGRPFR